ncbi:bromodomain-containing protein [Nostoc minutum NIES-26]|uniref:Bromodomain-containing protein n=1 Tax=Nostoc minutum NIES-26 TaxID=1844469 RepID=A0A367QTU0_9NOSO|nr:bromodomain-containing protein [Nostoc minutum NIES-26]
MNFKYKWKNGYMPSRDEAARSKYLLDASQFDNSKDRNQAEEQVRKRLGVPTRIPDDDRSILPHAAQEENSLDENQF